jgi:hypothetical protein
MKISWRIETYFIVPYLLYTQAEMLASKTIECNDVAKNNFKETVWVYINFTLEVLYERVIQSPHLNSPYVIEQVFNLFPLSDSGILFI